MNTSPTADISDAYAVNQVLVALSSIETVGQAVHIALDAVRDAFGWQYGSYWMIDTRYQVLTFFGESGKVNDSFRNVTLNTSYHQGVGLSGRAWKQRDLIFTKDLGAMPDCPRAAIARSAGVKSGVCFPIVVSNEVVGTMDFFVYDTLTLSAQRLEALRNVGQLVSLAIERIQTRERLTEERMRVWEQERALRQSVEQQNDELRALDRMKDEFVSSVSHEFRTPLTSIVGYTEMLLDSCNLIESEAEQHLMVIQRNAQRLRRLIEDLHFVARQDAQSADQQTGAVDLGDVLRKSVMNTQDVARSSNVMLRIESMKIAEVCGNQGELSSMVYQLLDNAVKFTPAGGTVTASVHVTNDDKVVLTVADTGYGIAAHELDHVFDRFYRGRIAIANAIRGTGIGLALVKNAIDSHYGAITISSTENTGTVVRVTLPHAAIHSNRSQGEPQ